MNSTIENDIQNWFIRHRKTLSLAESCTGGSLAARLTRQSGASKYFLGSLVVYSNALKTKLLHIPSELLEKYGAVSRETVEAMAKGTLQLTESDFAAAVSGIAGPTGGSIEKPVGTVWACIAGPQGFSYAWQFHIDGDRREVIERSVDLILQELLHQVMTSQIDFLRN